MDLTLHPLTARGWCLWLFNIAMDSPWRSVKLPETKMGCVVEIQDAIFFERKPSSPIFTIDSHMIQYD